jgi:hypothetical protein
MSQLFELVQKVDTLLKNSGKSGKDFFQIKGQISLKAGFILTAIKETTPDDPKQMAALKAAVKAVMGVDV